MTDFTQRTILNAMAHVVPDLKGLPEIDYQADTMLSLLSAVSVAYFMLDDESSLTVSQRMAFNILKDIAKNFNDGDIVYGTEEYKFQGAPLNG